MTVKEPSPLPAHSTRAPLDDPLEDPFVAPPLPSPPSCATLPPVSCTHRMSAKPSPLKSPPPTARLHGLHPGNELHPVTSAGVVIVPLALVSHIFKVLLAGQVMSARPSPLMSMASGAWINGGVGPAVTVRVP